MPKVGNKEFAYTEAGKKEAKTYAKKKNKKVKFGDGGLHKEYGSGGLHSEKRIVKTRGTGAATKGLNFHSSD
tara:strand:- start:407 stop:622 length:216 start_codon:yes stop_codon:yes gene_type:complete